MPLPTCLIRVGSLRIILDIRSIIHVCRERHCYVALISQYENTGESQNLVISGLYILFRIRNVLYLALNSAAILFEIKYL